MQTEANNEVEVTLFTKIKALFQEDKETLGINPKLNIVCRCVFGGSVAGFFIGGRIGGRIGGIEHIETTKLAVYQSATHAHREYQAKVVVGFVKNGCRFGWRAGLFSGLYSLLLVVLNEVNNECDHVNYMAAGMATGIVYKSLSGWRSMVVGAIVGTGLSLPAAISTTLVKRLAPDDMKDGLNVFGLERTSLETWNNKANDIKDSQLENATESSRNQNNSVE